ncbi:hypothetical protein G8C93_00715 [Cellulosimicrobium cellulans]|uniref:helix-turn-helix transcriptional regulator n=1 Tax=Cellulosimicrobium cellulans TaxID=1710 RepID=UPI0018832FA2|nr:hypothetical protein [Cellulosimicrobium cellulans]MBE9924414.1 hypothetical protein [Cellulosimicrobium cellulans]
MRTKFSVVVDGIKLSDISVLVLIQEHLDDLVWSSMNGRVTFSATLPEGSDVVCAASEAARRVLHAIPGVEIVSADRDIVSQADIAERIGVSRETVRTWARGMRGPGKFPIPIATVGGGARGGTDIWYWADVQSWLERHRGFAFSERPPSVKELAAMDAHFKRIMSPMDEGFRGAQESWAPSGRPSLYFKQASDLLSAATTEGWAAVTHFEASRTEVEVAVAVLPRGPRGAVA